MAIRIAIPHVAASTTLKVKPVELSPVSAILTNPKFVIDCSDIFASSPVADWLLLDAPILVFNQSENFQPSMWYGGIVMEI